MELGNGVGRVLQFQGIETFQVMCFHGTRSNPSEIVEMIAVGDPCIPKERRVCALGFSSSRSCGKATV